MAVGPIATASTLLGPIAGDAAIEASQHVGFLAPTDGYAGSRSSLATSF